MEVKEVASWLAPNTPSPILSGVLEKGTGHYEDIAHILVTYDSLTVDAIFRTDNTQLKQLENMVDKLAKAVREGEYDVADEVFDKVLDTIDSLELIAIGVSAELGAEYCEDPARVGNMDYCVVDPERFESLPLRLLYGFGGDFVLLLVHYIAKKGTEEERTVATRRCGNSVVLTAPPGLIGKNERYKRMYLGSYWEPDIILYFRTD